MTARLPRIDDRVHWNTGIADGRTGRIVALQSIPACHGTMSVEWDDGQHSKSLPQRLLGGDPRWSYAE